MRRVCSVFVICNKRDILTQKTSLGTAWIDLEDVKVPAENLIGDENDGFQILMSSTFRVHASMFFLSHTVIIKWEMRKGTLTKRYTYYDTDFNKERFTMAVGMNRRARTCLSISLAYAHSRTTFDKPLIANQIIKHKFSKMARYVESHWASLEQIAYHIKSRRLSGDYYGLALDELAGRIALAKVHAGRILEMACREAQQVLGGAGYQRGKGVGAAVEQISRDLRMLVVGGGSEEIIADLAVRQELAWASKKGANL